MPDHAIPQLLELAASEDAKLEIGATWVIKRLAEQGSPPTGGMAREAVDLLDRVQARDAVLHLLQTLPHMEIPADCRAGLRRALERHVGSRHAFVRAWAYNGLGVLAVGDRDLRGEVERLFDAAAERETAAVRARIRRARAAFPTAVLACLTAACGGDADPRVTAQVDTVGGVVAVRNGPGLWRDSERWQVVEKFRVGGSQWGENPAEELGYSRGVSVTLGPNGGIFVVEMATSRVLVFNGDGGFVRSFGRAGEGPGEFRNPTAMAWDGAGRLWVGDFDGRYHVFDSTGAFQKTVGGPFRYFARLQHPLLWEAEGTLVEEIGQEGMVLYLRVDTLGHLVDTAAVVPTSGRTRDPESRRLLPGWRAARFVLNHYRANHRWSLAPDGTIWSASSGQLRLVRTGPRGDTLRVVETSHRPAEFDARDRAVIAEGLAEAGIPRGDIELVRPVVDAIHVLDDGHIMVGIVEKVGEPTSTFDVFDPEGFFLGTVDLGFAMPNQNIPAIVGDTIVAVTPGDLDLPYLVRATIKRSG